MVASFQKVNPLVRKAGSFLVLTFICCCHTKVTEGRIGTDVVVEPWIMIVLTPRGVRNVAVISYACPVIPV